MIHELEEFTKVNIFVGQNARCVKGLCSTFAHSREYTLTDMTFGNGVYYRCVDSEIRGILAHVVHGYSVLLHVNSMDVIKALPDIVRELNLQDDFRLTRIGNSAKTSTKGEPIAMNYTLEELEVSIDMGLEMR